MVKIWEFVGGYLLIIGIFGVVMGLIYVMENFLDLMKLGVGIVVVFVVMIYGVGLVNFIYLLIVGKFKYYIICMVVFCEMLIDGFVGIVFGDNLCIIEGCFKGYLL